MVQQAWLRLERAVAARRRRDREPPGLADHGDDPAVPGPAAARARRCRSRRSSSSGPRPTRPTTSPSPTPSGIALQAVIDRLTPRERVAFVLHDSFGFEFATIAAVLDTTPAAARKLASRARAKVAQPAADGRAGRLGGGGRLHGGRAWRRPRPAARAARPGRGRRRRRGRGPGRHAGHHRGPRARSPRSSTAAPRPRSPVLVGDRPASAWFLRGEARVVFDFTVDATVRCTPSPSGPTPPSWPGSYAARAVRRGSAVTPGGHRPSATGAHHTEEENR